MSIFNTITKFVVKQFWPWFKEFVWPLLKEHVIELIVVFLKRFKSEIRDWVSGRSERRSTEAEEKAAAAENKAKATSDVNEAERLRATAQVWREVAEQLRRDNDELKAKIDEVEAEAKAAAEGTVQEMDFDLDFTEAKPVLLLDKNRHKLPELPGQPDP